MAKNRGGCVGVFSNQYSCETAYDPEFDFLSFTRPGFRSTGSVVAGSVTVDLHKDEFVGLEIEGASDLFESLLGFRPDLSKISAPKVGYREKGSVLLFSVSFSYENHVYAKDILLPKVEPLPVLSAAAGLR